MSPLYWSSPSGSIAGGGATITHNPGTGDDRYRRAADWLTTSPGLLAFASFTFDPEDPFSVVMTPELFDRNWQPSANTLPRGRIVDDGRAVWSEGFDQARAALDQKRVEKVVLARQVRLEFDSEVPVEAVLARLISYNVSSHVFSLDGLIGASPELLVRVVKGRVTSLVLAGTAPDVDGLDSPLISEEHAFAADSVRAALGPLTSKLNGEQSPLVFGKISHLATRFEATALPGVGVLDLVGALHPTAAVGGTPSDEALRLIRAMEPRSRGRYAGPIGWFDGDGNGEFALALRCGQILGDQVTLYAGGGLVLGADHDREWEETEMKLGPMLRGLDVGHD